MKSENYFSALRGTYYFEEWTKFMEFLVECLIKEQFPRFDNVQILPMQYDDLFYFVEELIDHILSFFIFNDMKDKANYFFIHVIKQEFSRSLINNNIGRL